MEVVYEDWGEDFVFDAHVDDQHVDWVDGGEHHQVEWVSSVVIPQAIKERQANVHGDLGHVKDFALLVEELKRLRARACAKGIVEGPSAELWREADDIIDLATSDDESPAFPPVPPPRSPSSPSLTFDPFDDDASPVTAASRKRRKSVLSLDDDFFAGPSLTSTGRDRSAESLTKTAAAASTTPLPLPLPLPPAMPRLTAKLVRHDSVSSASSASVARTVIDTMHQRRAGSGSSSTTADSIGASTPRKMPFDSTTLRELVTHVRLLCLKLAELVRCAESSLSSQNKSPHSPRLSPIQV